MSVHRKVQCWIFSKVSAGDEPQCLLLRTNDQRGGYWQPVTGTVEPNEGFFQAACREPMEETKFDFIGTPTDTKSEFEFVSRNGLTKERIFYLEVEGTPTPVLDPKEHQDFQWTTPKEALKLLKFPSNIEGLRKTFRFCFQRTLEENA